MGQQIGSNLTEILHMGYVPYLEFLGGGKITREDFEGDYNAAYRQSLKVRGQFLGSWDRCVGSFGTLLAIEKALIEYDLFKSGIDHANPLPLLEMLLTFEHLDSMSFRGLEDNRRQLFVCGLAITIALFDALGEWCYRMALYEQSALRSAG